MLKKPLFWIIIVLIAIVVALIWVRRDSSTGSADKTASNAPALTVSGNADKSTNS